MKTCPCCKESKPLTKYHKSKSRKNSVCVYCKKCRTIKAKTWWKDKGKALRTSKYCEDNGLKISARKSELKKKYNMTLEDYKTLHDKQDGVCAICGQPETSKLKDTVKDLSVDHCHKTGRIRGLLCTHCNHAIGKFKDKVGYLTKAIEYLSA